MTTRTVVFASSNERGREAIEELGLPPRTPVVTPRNGRTAARGFLIGRIIMVDDAFPDDYVRQMLLCASLAQRNERPVVFRWRRSAL